MKTYRSKETVRAKEYEPGMEDGFVTRYGCKEPDGSYSTYGIGTGEEGEEEIKVPYVICPVTKRKVLVGYNYMIVESQNQYDAGEYFSMTVDEFNEKYEE